MKCGRITRNPLLGQRVRGQTRKVYTRARVRTVVLALKYGHDPDGLGAAIVWTKGEGTELRMCLRENS